MQKKAMALCLRVQFFLANPVFTELFKFTTKTLGNNFCQNNLVFNKIERT